MRVARRAISALIFIAPIAVLIAVGVLLVRRYYQRAERDLEPILAAELTHALGHETRIGRVTLERNSATVTDVHVALGPTFRASGGREIASAKRVIIDFDIRQILLEKNPRIPYVARAHVIEPFALIGRSATGRWNFADIFRPRKVKPARPAIGSVTVERGHFLYEDSSPPHHPQRAPTSIHAEFTDVYGSMQFYPDDTVTWTGAGNEITGLAASASVLGSYDPTPRKLYLRIGFNRLALPGTSRFLRPGDDVTAGFGYGKLTLARIGADPFDYQVDARIEGAAVVTKRLGEPVTGVCGEATVSDSIATARLDGVVAGSPIHVEGSVFDFDHPVVNGWASGSDLRLGRLISTLKLHDRASFLQGLEARGVARVDIRGDLNNPTLTGSAQVSAGGTMSQNVVAATAPVAVTFNGPLDDPRFTAAGTLPIVRYREYVARNVQVSVALNAKRAGVDFAGRFAGGFLAGRANLDFRAKNTQYAAQVRGRGISLDGILVKSPSQLSGKADFDASIAGSSNGKKPSGTATVQVSSLKYNDWNCDKIVAQVKADHEQLRIGSVVARLGNGIVVADGSVNLDTRETNLQIQADEIDLDRLPQSRSSDGVHFGGLVYLREGRVTGDFRNPHFSGQIRGYDFAAGSRPQIDYIAALLSGNRQALTIRNGQAWHFPAVTTVDGIISRPLSKRAQIEISGAFDKVDLQDIAGLAGSDLQASGTATGEWHAEGYLLRPLVTATGIRIDEPTVGEAGFDSLALDAIYDATSGSGELRIPAFTAITRAATVTGSAKMVANREFEINAGSDGVKLTLLQPYVADYLLLDGTADVRADLFGRIEGGNFKRLGGTVRADTHGLLVNHEQFGELHTLLDLDGDVIHSRETRLAGPSGEAVLTQLDYNRTTGSIQGSGEVHTLSLDAMRRAISNSPYVIDNPESLASSRLKPITNPFTGVINASFTLGGATSDPDAWITWSVPPNSVVIEGQSIHDFSGTVHLRRDLIDLPVAKLTAETTVVKAHGLYVPDKRLEGEADLNNLPLTVLKRWFPDSSLLFRTADIQDPRAFAERLRDAQDPVTVYLRSRLSPDARRLLEEYRGPLKPSDDLQIAVIRSLNNIIRTDTSLYDPNRFAGVTLSQGLRSRLAARPSGRSLALVHRLLIAEALPNELVQGLPERPMLEGLSGMADKVNVVASGDPSSPVITATVELSNTAWADPDGQVLGGRAIEFEKISTSPITIGGGKVRVADVAIRIAEPNRPIGLSAQSGAAKTPAGNAAGGRANVSAAPKTATVTAAAPAITPAGPYEAHLRDVQFDFSWASLGLPENAKASLELDINRQGLGILTTLAQSAPRILDGTVTARVRYDGPVNDLSPTSRSLDARAIETRLTGSIEIHAPRIAFDQMSTELRNLDASLSFTGATLRVNQFSVQTQVVHPRYASKLSDPLQIVGELAIRDPAAAPGLTITAPKVIFGEGPLPGVGTGAAVGEASTRSIRPGASPTEALRITGTLFDPTVTGNVYVRNAWLKTPDAFQTQKRVLVAFPVFPRFAVRFITDNDVRISTTQMNAYVRTSESEPIELTGTVIDPRLAGTLVVQRGTLAFPTARFTIQRGGTVALRYPAAMTGNLLDTGLAVNVNLTAVTRISASSVNGYPRRYTITVEARGPLNSNEPLQIIDPNEIGATRSERGLRLTFRSDPPDLALSSAGLQRRITGILGGQGAIEELFSKNPNVARAFSDQFTDILSASLFPELLERAGIARALGFEELTVEYNRLDAFTLRVSRQLFGPLYVGYWRRLSGANREGNLELAAWEFKLSYRLATNIQFSWTYDEQRTNALLLEGVFRY